MKWLMRAALAIAVIYATLFAAVLVAMRQPPERFGQIVMHVPEPLIWGALPARHMWSWARAGTLAVGDPAPEFTLSTHDHQGQVTLSSHRGRRPVVLVFGSYT